MTKVDFFSFFLLMTTSVFTLNSWGFACRDSDGNYISDASTSFDVNVVLDPKIEVGKVLVIDLSKNLRCSNSDPDIYNDYISITKGTAFSGDLSHFSGSMNFYGSTYSLPLSRRTKEHNIKSKAFIPLNIFLYLTPIKAASGVVIKKGDEVGMINLFKRATWVDNDRPAGDIDIKWTIRAANDVIIPVGGCDVSSRNVIITLPDYPGTAPIPLTVSCTESQNLSYFLTGMTESSTDSIFSNTSSATPAAGVGVQLSNNDGIIAANKNVSLGTVGTNPVSLGLSASYARTSGDITAGNVQSIIGVTFVYE
ncbi:MULTISPECIES: fimbrial protein [unclassified Serratia (in: enterobacteria)]|uniref:fimbrial protein n=1 Tax=unclassified Serratia (in: enterobacteria) TaxID=2647522 RepID=UPI0027F321EF|nr:MULTISPECIES: fimbrial protein [unclassified Serratia (in: enterobacteria)]MDQ7099069.1 fimbrial protein [Serratia sp. MF2]MDQ7105575.1 fimbrial protein [Serratia sp. MF1(2023)]